LGPDRARRARAIHGAKASHRIDGAKASHRIAAELLCHPRRVEGVRVSGNVPAAA
jgi:hypothetical protein